MRMVTLGVIPCLAALACASSQIGPVASNTVSSAGRRSSPTVPPGTPAPEFESQDASRWVNGEAFTLAGARGSVVLVESWHRL